MEHEKEIEEESEETLAEDLFAYKRMTPAQIRKRERTKKKNRGKNLIKKRKRRQVYKRKKPTFRLKRKKWRNRTRGRRRYAELLAERYVMEKMIQRVADMFYEKRPPDEDEIYYPSGTNYSPSGGNGYYKFDPSNKERRPSEVQNTDGEQPDVGNTSRVVPNGQFVKASAKPKSLDTIDKKIQTFEGQSRAYVEKLKEIREDIEEAYLRKRFSAYKVGRADLVRMFENPNRWVDILSDIDEILRDLSDDAKNGHF